MVEASVAEIHEYPVRPEGFEEPLFPTAESKRAVMDHFLQSGWLGRAAELSLGPGHAAHLREEPVKICRGRADGRVVLLSRCGRRTRRRVVTEIVERWREVGEWWEDGCGDRRLYRLLLADGAVLDVARDGRSGAWTLVGVVD